MTNCRVLAEVFAKLENFSYPDREVPFIHIYTIRKLATLDNLKEIINC